MYAYRKNTSAATVRTKTKTCPRQSSLPQKNSVFLGLESNYTAHALPTQSKNTGTPLQRKIGMEFQVMGSTDVLDSNQESSAHGILLKKCDGFNITADMGNYEYVTKPVDERLDSEIDNLKRYCDNSGRSHRNITQKLNPDKPTIYHNDYWQYTPEDSATHYWVRQSRKKTAHPQATVGIRLDKLTTFVKEYVKDSTDRLTAPRRKFILAHGGTKKRIAGEQHSELRAISINQESLQGMTSLSPKAHGLLTMLSIMARNYYLYRKKYGNPVNAKSAIPIMPRTSLYDIFATLTPVEQTLIKNLNITQNSDILSYIVGDSHARKDTSKDNGFPPKTVANATTNMLQVVLACESNTAREQVTSLADFLGSLPLPGSPSGQDVFSTYHSLSSISNTDTAGFDISRSTDIGYDHDAEQIHGMLLELRDLQRGVETSQWSAVAEKAAKLTRFVNTGSMNQADAI